MYSNLRFKNQLLYQVGPQAIYVVGRDEDDESIAAGSDGSNDAASWETVEDDTDSINHPEVNGVIFYIVNYFTIFAKHHIIIVQVLYFEDLI